MKRDSRLDLIKGLACVLMVIVHTKTLSSVVYGQLSLFLLKWAFFASVLFFISHGTALVYQLKKHTLINILAGYILMALFSFADMGIIRPFYIFDLKNNLLLSLAISSIILVLFKKYFNNILVVILPIGLYYLFQIKNLPSSFFYGNLFSIIPWIFFILVGFYLYHHKALIKPLTILSFVASIVIFYITKTGIYDETVNVLFLSLGLFIYGMIFIFSSPLSRFYIIDNILKFFGSNSLLFYALHRIVILSLPQKIFAPLAWLIVISITGFFMFFLKRIKIKLINSNVIILLSITLIFTPYLMHLSFPMQRIILTISLVFYALIYRNLIFRKNI